MLALPDLEHAKTAVLNSLSSASGQRNYEHAIREFVAWYCSEPRLAFVLDGVAETLSYAGPRKSKSSSTGVGEAPLA